MDSNPIGLGDVVVYGSITGKKPPIHVQLPYHGAAEGVVDIDYQVMNNMVFLFIRQFSFVVGTKTNLEIQLPNDCLLSTSTNSVSWAHTHTCNGTAANGVNRLNISTGLITIYAGPYFEVNYFPVGSSYVMYDQLVWYLLV